MNTFTRVALAATLATPVLAHDDPVELVLEGDVVAGVGTVTSVSNLVVNDAGVWIVEADTDHANGDADGVLMQTGFLLLREGDALAAPVGASVGSFDPLTLNESSETAWNLFLDGTAGVNDDSAVYLGSALLIQEGDTLTAAGVSPGTEWLGFFDVKRNNSDQILIVGSMEDPGIVPSTVDRVLALVDVTGGVLGAVTIIAMEAQLLPGQTLGVTDIGTNPQETALNDNGDVLFAVDIPGVDAIYLNATEVAQEGDASPIAGRNWQSLTSTSIGLNDHGDYVFRGDLNGDTSDDNVIIKNGAVFVREGDTRPEIMPFTITNFGSGPVQIANNDSVLWFAEWNDPDTDLNSGLFVDDELVIQEGVTEVGGVVFDTIRGITDGYGFSPSGEYIIFEGVLENGVEGAFLVQLETLDAHSFCTPVVNSTGSPALITAQGSSSLIENNLVLLAQPMASSEPGVFYYGPNEIQAPFGNGFRCVGGTVVRLWPPVVSNGGGVLLRAIDFQSLPSGAAINAGETWKFQAWFRDPPAGGLGFNLSDGLSITFSP
jgi:hypothetical protein